MNIINKHISCCLALAMAACAFLTGCGQSEPHDEPQLNPHPKYFLTVKGRIDPAIAHNVNLVWSISYATNNEQDNKCQNVVDRFAGAIFPLTKDDSYTVQPNQQGYYAYNIALDKYIPGYCKWLPLAAAYEFKLRSNGYRAFMNIKFDSKKNERPNFYQDTWRCNSEYCDLLQFLNRKKYEPITVHYHGNYVYALHIEVEKKQ